MSIKYIILNCKINDDVLFFNRNTLSDEDQNTEVIDNDETTLKSEKSEDIEAMQVTKDDRLFIIVISIFAFISGLYNIKQYSNINKICNNVTQNNQIPQIERNLEYNNYEILNQQLKRVQNELNTYKNKAVNEECSNCENITQEKNEALKDKEAIILDRYKISCELQRLKDDANAFRDDLTLSKQIIFSDRELNTRVEEAIKVYEAKCKEAEEYIKNARVVYKEATQHRTENDALKILNQELENRLRILSQENEEFKKSNDKLNKNVKCLQNGCYSLKKYIQQLCPSDLESLNQCCENAIGG